MEKLLDFMTLEPVEDFETGFQRGISVSAQVLIRVCAVAVNVAVLAGMHGMDGLVKTVVKVIATATVSELVWNGYREFAYLADFIIHEATVWMFIYVTATAANPLLGLAGVALVHVLSPLERRELHEAKDIDQSLVVEWSRFYERSTKIKYWSLVLIYAILTNFTTLVL